MMFRLSLIVGALPVTLVNGTTADATQVMADLNWIVNQVNANAAPLANTALTNANNNFTVVQSGQPATQPANFPTALQIENNSLQTLSSILGTNTLTARVSAIPLGAYVSGQVFTFVPANPNTGNATLNIDGNGARSIFNMGSGLSGAELQNYRPSVVAFNGNTNAFDLVNGTQYVKGPNIPAAATLNLDGTFGDYSQVDGIATITAMTLSPGRQKLLEFTSSPQLTNSATLILGSNVLTKPGDVLSFRGEAGGIARLTGGIPGGPRYLSNSLTSDVALSNNALFFDGPQVAQGNGGVWYASGTLTFGGGTSGQLAAVKLWDGTNIVAAAFTPPITATGVSQCVSLSGVFVNPLGNIRLSARNLNLTTQFIKATLIPDGIDLGQTASVITVVKLI